MVRGRGAGLAAAAVALATAVAAAAEAKKAPPAEAPAIDVATAQLPDAADAIAAGQYTPAIKVLDRVRPLHKTDPRYYIIRGCAYVGLDNDALAAGGFRYAARLNAKLAEAYALCGLAYARMGRLDDAKLQCSACDKQKPTDPLALYTLGLARLRLREWEGSKTAFTKAAESSSPVGKEAKARLKDVEEVQAAEAEATRKYEASRKKARDAVKQAAADLEKAKAAGRGALAKKEALRRDYEAERRDVERDYQRRINDINQEHARRMPPPYLAATDPRRYQREVSSADAWRNGRINEANHDRTRRYKSIDDRFRPKVQDVDKEIAGQADEVRRLQAEQVKLGKALVELLTAEGKRELAGPFDFAGETKKLMGWVCKKHKAPLSSSAAPAPAAPR